jgi:GTP-binding protein HflX
MSHVHHPTQATEEGRRQVILVITSPPELRHLDADREKEMISLIDTAGADVVATVSQHLQRPLSRTYIGSGKVEEVRQAVLMHEANEVIFDTMLSPRQERNLEQDICVPVIDYAGLILHIFAQNARTHQAQLAVELAQLQYHRSRLKRLWTHLDRIKAGTNMRGPGEKQLEVDRRLIDQRIRELRDRLDDIAHRKERAVASRTDCLKVCLVGYTNAGKSTLMNALTQAGVLAQDRLFATLDTRTARLDWDHGQSIVLSDTVGFIRDLPPSLIASFHATLTEVTEADLLLHVVDAGQPALEEHINAVEEVLETIGAGTIPTVMIFNKADQPHSKAILLAFRRRYPGSLLVSAKSGDGLEELREKVVEISRAGIKQLIVSIPIADGATMAFVQRNANVIHEDFNDQLAHLTIEAEPELEASLQKNPNVRCVEAPASETSPK